MAEAERVSGQPFPPAPRVAKPWETALQLPGGTLGEILSGVRVLRPEDKLAHSLSRAEAALGRLERALSLRLPKG